LPHISFAESQFITLKNYEPVKPPRMEFIAFEFYSLIFFPTLSIRREAHEMYPFTTTFQTSNPSSYRNALILKLQKEYFFPSTNGVAFFVNPPCLSIIFLPVVTIFLKEPSMIPIVRIFTNNKRGWVN
jgi:hypothetical protein